ncbi:hypothetical protein O7A60_11425 [Mesorhizobium sp. Ld1326N3]|uniref:Uncharacterized protein n=1 Tax=Mesorhizobium salmacidum TaxID=3015171 RepID=A0ABU8KW99_9HYPH
MGDEVSPVIAKHDDGVGSLKYKAQDTDPAALRISGLGKGRAMKVDDRGRAGQSRHGLHDPFPPRRCIRRGVEVDDVIRAGCQQPAIADQCEREMCQPTDTGRVASRGQEIHLDRTAGRRTKLFINVRKQRLDAATAFQAPRNDTEDPDWIQKVTQPFEAPTWARVLDSR